GKERIPIRPPQNLDDIPTRANEKRLQLLDDLAVTAHGTIEALEVAVDDEREIVQLLPCRQRQGTDGFGLIHFTIAEHSPNVTLVSGNEPPIRKVAHESRLIDRVDGADAHGTRRKLPERRHQPGMGVRTEAPSCSFLAIVSEMLRVDAPLQK